VIPQLPLELHLDQRADFDSFLAGANAEVLTQVRRLADGPGESYAFVWGPPGVGKTHLLQAAVKRVQTLGQTPAFLPLGDAQALRPEMIEGLERLDLVCIDDIQAIAGQEEWEEGLFDLFNRLRTVGGRLLVAADQPPTGLGIALADLVSRLGWGLVLRLRELSDLDKQALLVDTARRRGMDLPVEVARYLISRRDRDLPSLLTAVDRLDTLSLAAQRKLTIPFVRQHLD
jgi:DnaA family protein